MEIVPLTVCQKLVLRDRSVNEYCFNYRNLYNRAQTFYLMKFQTGNFDMKYIEEKRNKDILGQNESMVSLHSVPELL